MLDNTTPAAPGNVTIFSVSSLGKAILDTLEGAFDYVQVEGEISGLKIPGSGHVYFNLKDSDALLACVCWRGVALGLAVKPQDGLSVVATGRITSYAPQSRYQLQIEQLRLAGVGALLQQLEALKKRLSAEGLFDASRKKAIPTFPQTIGLITSPTGAVIRDMLHRIRARFPCRVLLYPVAVQGADAAAQVCSALRFFNNSAAHRPDVLIIARGGGSLEDLWCFNDEQLVRAAAASRIPVISAIGHETDVTLLDFAADRRAPTPSAAAEFAVPDGTALRAALSQLNARLQRSVSALPRLEQRLDELALRRPQALRQRSEHAGLRLSRLDVAAAFKRLIPLKKTRFDSVAARLRGDVVMRRCYTLGQQLSETQRRRFSALNQCAALRFARVERAAALLGALSYTRILARGYAVVRDKKGHVLSSAAAWQEPSATIHFHDAAVAVRREDAKAGKKTATPHQKEPRLL